MSSHVPQNCETLAVLPPCEESLDSYYRGTTSAAPASMANPQTARITPLVFEDLILLDIPALGDSVGLPEELCAVSIDADADVDINVDVCTAISPLFTSVIPGVTTTPLNAVLSSASMVYVVASKPHVEPVTDKELPVTSLPWKV